MGEMITKPDANPILLAILNLLICGFPIGHAMIGQTKKAVVFFVATIVLSFFGIGVIVPWIAAYDVYLLGVRLKNGESIPANANGLSFLDSIPGFN